MTPAIYQTAQAWTANPAKRPKRIPRPEATPACPRSSRQPFTQPAAKQPPSVLEGEGLASTFWVGDLLNTWAENWVSYWTNGRGRFATSLEEDAGIMQAITFLGKAHRADPARVLILRTASDYTVPPPGMIAADQLKADETGGLSGFAESLASAYAVASPVVRYLAAHGTPGDQ